MIIIHGRSFGREYKSTNRRRYVMRSEKAGCDFTGRTFPNRIDIGAHGGLCECVDGKWVRIILVSGI